MMDKELLRTEAAHYRLLADQLKEDYGHLDDETLHDTLQGLSELPEMIEEIVRSSLDDEALIAGLKTRIEAMNARIGRLKERHERKRQLSTWVMGCCGIAKLEASDFSVSLSHGQMRLQVVNEALIPPLYLVPQPPKLDKVSLAAALKRGDAVEGANLIAGDPYIMVRTR